MKLQFKDWLMETTDLRGIHAQLKQMLPAWPDYIIDDMLVAGFRNPDGFKSIEDAKDYLDNEFPQQYGRRADRAKWAMMSIDVNMNAWDSVTMQTLPQRVAGDTHQGPSNKNDAARNAYAASSLTGSSYQEPIIVAKMGGKYQLIEGWHRVIELLKKFPQGTQQQAWVMS